MEDLLKPFISGGVMSGLDSLLILPEELAVLSLRKTPEDHLRIVRILPLDRLCGHDAESTLNG